MTYSEKLKDPRWQKKRLEILERDEFYCQHCGNEEITLHVHHLSYSKQEPWDIDNTLLVTLCEYCHSKETEAIKDATKLIVSVLKAKGLDSHDINRLSWFFTKLTKEEIFKISAPYGINGSLIILK